MITSPGFAPDRAAFVGAGFAAAFFEVVGLAAAAFFFGADVFAAVFFFADIPTSR